MFSRISASSRALAKIPAFPNLKNLQCTKISVGTVDKRYQVTPILLADEKVRYINRPAAIGLRLDRLHAIIHLWPVTIKTLPTLLVILFLDPVDFLTVEELPVQPAQHDGDSSSPVFGELPDHLTNLINKSRFVSFKYFLMRLFGVVHVRPVEAKHLAAIADICPNPVVHQFYLLWVKIRSFP